MRQVLEETNEDTVRAVYDEIRHTEPAGLRSHLS